MSTGGLALMAVGSLMLAATIYVLFRSGARLHDWAAAGDVLGVLAWLRSASAGLEPPAIVRYSVPDALWQLSFTTLVWLAWRSHPWNAVKVLCCAAPIVIGLGCELGQLVGWVEGVFDPVDLALSVLAIAAAVAVVRPAPVPRGDGAQAAWSSSRIICSPLRLGAAAPSIQRSSPTRR